MSKKLTYDELQTAVLKLINDADLHREPYRSNTAKRIIWLVQDNIPEQTPQTADEQDWLDKILLNLELNNRMDNPHPKRNADEAKAAITARMKQEIAQTFLAGMPELTPRQQEYITKRLEEL